MATTNGVPELRDILKDCLKLNCNKPSGEYYRVAEQQTIELMIRTVSLRDDYPENVFIECLQVALSDCLVAINSCDNNGVAFKYLKGFSKKILLCTENVH